ncbi:hypothetical protein HJG54_32170 [Leptolyngbya sp. NK1-12]|uniref:Uncharacterized protein n=1 Tax=Leptolyngbya sp. NK1-12 TaxID=2547451 RepID=A0AA96WKE6_9CYAN|nr:hypothetical protein [Leptolyngbya sp. NK1-12]WNZ27532.1 hypothetical protein HJG54_32170 [Leptolyngbya sp. NK1-12]
MARPINPKCWECSLLDSKTAKALHGETGDGCWDDRICHRRRSHYRNRADNNQKRKGQYISVKASHREALRDRDAVKPAAPPVALLYLYREPRRDAHLHALAITIWQGDQKLKEFPPTHCMGMTNSQVRQYLQTVLQDLNQTYGIKTFEPEIRYDPSFCPIEPCPLKSL